jgi:hypothetical protein
MIAALLFLGQVVPVPAEPKPIETSIAAIHASPKKFDGAVVRLRGWVNSCDQSTCTIDERATSGPAGRGQGLSIAADKKFEDTIRPLLPTYVEFDARLDATCLVAVCPNRAAVLTVVTLRGVVSPEPPSFEN